VKHIELNNKQIALVDDEDFIEHGKYSWQLNDVGYARRTFKEKGKKDRTVLLHRLIANAPKGKVVDHINGNKLDNRKENLRITTYSKNGLNRHTVNRNNKSSGFCGVRWNKSSSKWQAYIRINYKSINLGFFKNINDAINARLAGEKYYANQ